MKVYIYRVVGMLEFDVDEPDMDKALKIGMERCAKVDIEDFKKVDQEFLAVALMEGEEETK